MDHYGIADDISSICDGIDWNDPDAFLLDAARVMKRAANASVLRLMLENVRDHAELLQKCERFNLFSKVVLSEGKRDQRWKLRLHLFEQEVLEAHHHRASFCASVLSGSYKHLLFGSGGSLDEARMKKPWRPLFAQIQGPGSIYFIDHEMVHATLVQSLTVTLMLQAPAAVDHFDIVDLATGQRRTRYGGRPDQPPQELGEAALSAADIDAIVSRLSILGLIA